MRPFVDRYPLFLQRSPEFRDIQEALEPELLELWGARDGAVEQLCADTADWGLLYWEKTLGLSGTPEKALEIRRNRVKARLLGTEVTTVSLLRHLAESFAGGETSVIEYPERFWVELGFPGINGIPPNLGELAASLPEIMPAHLGWGLTFQYANSGTLSASAHAELNSALEVWPQIVNELETGASAAVGAVMEYRRHLELQPISIEEEESA